MTRTAAGSSAVPAPSASRRRSPAGARSGSGRPRWVGGLLAATVVAAAGCTSAGGEGGTGPYQDPLVPAGEFRLVSYDSCAQAAEHLRAATRQHIGPWGLGGGAVVVMPDVIVGDGAGAVPEPAVAERAAPEQALQAAPEAPVREPAGDPAAPAYSGTNVHEAGVDEPDVIKTDGRRIVTVNRGVLRVVDAASRVETGRLPLNPGAGDAEIALVQVADLLLYGDQALVLLREGYGTLPPVVPGPGVPEPAPLPEPPGAPRDGSEVAPALPEVAPDLPDGPPAPEPDDPPAEDPIYGPTMLLVDLSGAPKVLSEYLMDGQLVDARAVGPTARVVVRSTPRLDLPDLPPDLDPAERLEANQAAVDDADISAWLPRYQVTTGGQTSTGQVDCTALSRPAYYTGTSLVTVLTFDLDAPALGDGDPVTVVTDGETVYSNGPSLYLAHDLRWQLDWQRWLDPDDPVDDGGGGPRLPEVDDRTEIHKFDTSGPGTPRYVGSGAVDGWLINQYAMSEWDGHLRVATTRGDDRLSESGTTESTVYVLAERDGSLVEVGSVGGLGKGERIYAVRFAGPIGYVVTFRQTDPLYTVDLSDPTAPAVRGELKITGYSAYLHPLDDGRLIGVGQEADEQGRLLGTQVSVFDVSDLDDPRRVAQHHVEYGHSQAEFDPHAFLWWAPEGLVVLPLVSFEGDSGALLLRLAADGGRADVTLTEVGTIAHPVDPDRWYPNEISRSLVIGDVLWTVSEAGLAAHQLATLQELAWLPY